MIYSICNEVKWKHTRHLKRANKTHTNLRDRQKNTCRVSWLTVKSCRRSRGAESNNFTPFTNGQKCHASTLGAQTFSLQNIFTWQWGKSTGVNNEINDGWIAIICSWYCARWLAVKLSRRSLTPEFNTLILLVTLVLFLLWKIWRWARSIFKGFFHRTTQQSLSGLWKNVLAFILLQVLSAGLVWQYQPPWMLSQIILHLLKLRVIMAVVARPVRCSVSTSSFYSLWDFVWTKVRIHKQTGPTVQVETHLQTSICTSIPYVQMSGLTWSTWS